MLHIYMSASPDQCGSVGWVSSHKVKGCWAHAWIAGLVPGWDTWGEATN